MKKVVVTFGLLSGAVSAAMMLMTVPFMHRIGFDYGLVVGYTAIVLSFLFVFFGIRSYRDNVAGGSVTFGRALGVGILIALISSLCYVVTWEFVYFNLMPDFWEKYSAYAVEHARAAGASQQTIDETSRQMREFKQVYDQAPHERGLHVHRAVSGRAGHCAGVGGHSAAPAPGGSPRACAVECGQSRRPDAERSSSCSAAADRGARMDGRRRAVARPRHRRQHGALHRRERDAADEDPGAGSRHARAPPVCRPERHGHQLERLRLHEEDGRTARTCARRSPTRCTSSSSPTTGR